MSTDPRQIPPEENPEALEFPIVGEDDKKRFAIARRQERIADEEAFEALGCKVLKTSTRVRSALGRYANKHSMKNRGLGGLVIAGARVEEHIEELKVMLAEMKSDPTITVKDRAEVHRIKLELEKVLIDHSQRCLDADKAASEVGQHELRMAFPAGTQMAFATGGGAAPKEIAPREIGE